MGIETRYDYKYYTVIDIEQWRSPPVKIVATPFVPTPTGLPEKMKGLPGHSTPNLPDFEKSRNS